MAAFRATPMELRKWALRILEQLAKDLLSDGQRPMQVYGFG